MKMRGSKDAMVRSQNGGMVQKNVRPLREKRDERGEKREETDKHDQDERVEGRKGSTPEWRGGAGRGGKGSASNRKEAERGMVPARVRPHLGKREESTKSAEKKERSTIKLSRHDLVICGLRPCSVGV